ncbi:MAG: hypothetical protein ACQGVC_22005 [Myxococcota bacterium]
MTYATDQLAVLVLLLLALWAAGLAIERRVAGGAAPGLRALSTAVLGTVAWTSVLFALACLGGLAKGGLLAAWLGFSAAAAVGRRDHAAPIDRRGLAFLAAVALATSPLLVLALSWEVSWDAAAYHLTLPKHWVAARGFVPAAGSVYASWPLATELLYAAALVLGDHPVAKALHGVFGLAALGALWVAARAFHQRLAAWIAAPLVLASPVVLFEWSVAYVDLAYAFFFTAGLVFATRWRASDGADRHALWLAGVCGGALAGLKVNGVLGAAALGAALLPTLLARRAAGRGPGDALRFAAPVLLLWLPWLVKSALDTGNPVHPLLFGVFGGADWSDRLSQQFLDWQRSIGPGRGAKDFALLPFRVVLDAGPTYDRFGGVIGAHWLVVVPLAWWGRANPFVRTAALACAVYFVLWAAGSQQARFLVPILPPLALCGSIGALELLSRLAGARARPAALLLLAASLALCGAALRAPAERALALLPRLSAGEAALRADALLPVHHFVATLPGDAKLLLMNTNQAFFLDRAYEADSFFEASQIADRMRGIDDARQARDHLAARGITHVLWARRDWGIDWPAGLVALLADRQLAARRFLDPDGSHAVYELLPPPAESP